jgi:hypothetical protein
MVHFPERTNGPYTQDTQPGPDVLAADLEVLSAEVLEVLEVLEVIFAEVLSADLDADWSAHTGQFAQFCAHTLCLV